MEDLLEEIVGEIRDEHDSTSKKSIPSSRSTEAVVEAGTNIEDVNARLGTELADRGFRNDRRLHGRPFRAAAQRRRRDRCSRPRAACGSTARAAAASSRFAFIPTARSSSRKNRRTLTQPRAYKTRGVVLRGRQLGEADRILTLFTLERGKLDGVAKGVRRPRSHLARPSRVGQRVRFPHAPRPLARGDRERPRSTTLTGRGSSSRERYAVVALLAELDRCLLRTRSGNAGRVRVLGRRHRCRWPPRSRPDRCCRVSRCGCSICWVWRRRSRAASVAARRSGRVRSGSTRRRAASSTRSADRRWRDLPELEARDLENLRGSARPKQERGAAALLATAAAAAAVDELVAHHLGKRPKALGQLGALGA